MIAAMRVATYNLWGRQGAWIDRRSVLSNELRELQPDIIAFQEAVVVDGYDQVDDLIGTGYSVFHQTGRSEDGVGASVASRWPIVDAKEAELNVTPRVDPAMGWIGSVAMLEIQAPDPIGTLLFVHYKPSWQRGFEYERELQAVRAARLIEEAVGKRNLHVVLAGDFDATPDAASMRFWRGRQSLDDWIVCYADQWSLGQRSFWRHC